MKEIELRIGRKFYWPKALAMHGVKAIFIGRHCFNSRSVDKRFLLINCSLVNQRTFSKFAPENHLKFYFQTLTNDLPLTGDIIVFRATILINILFRLEDIRRRPDSK